MSKDFSDLKEYVLDRRRYGATYRSDKWDPTFQAALDAYSTKARKSKSGEDLNLPETFIRTEILTAHALSDFFGYTKSPLIPFGMSEETQQIAEKIRMLWEFRARQTRFVQKMVPFFRQAFLLGTSFAAVTWDTRFRFNRKRKTSSQLLGVAVDERDLHYLEMISSQPRVTVLDIMACWTDPDAESVDLREVREFGFDRWMTKDELYQYAAFGEYDPSGVDAVDWAKVSSRYSASPYDYIIGTDRRKEILGVTPTVYGEASPREQILVSECWCDYVPPKGKFPVLMKVVIVDPGGQDIMLTPFGKAFPVYGNSPYDHGEKPFIGMNFISRDFCLWGVGLGEALEGLDAEYQELINLRLKNIQLTVDKMKAVNTGAIVDPKQLASRPGGVIEFRGPIRDNLKEIENSDVGPSISMQVGEIRQFMDEVSGVDVIMRSGGTPSGGKTPMSATESNLRQSMAGRRFGFVLNSMMDQGPVRIAEMMLALERQHMEQPLTFRSMSQNATTSEVMPGYVTIEPEELGGEFDFFFVGDPLRANENTLRNQQLTAAGLMLNPALQQVIKPWAVGKEIAKAIEWPWQDVLVSAEQAADMEVAQIMARAQAEAQMHLGPPQPEGQEPAEGGKGPQEVRPGSMGLPPTGAVEGQADMPPVPTPEVPLGQAPIPEGGGVMS